MRPQYYHLRHASFIQQPSVRMILKGGSVRTTWKQQHHCLSMGGNRLKSLEHLTSSTIHSEAPKLELKELPQHQRYAFLGENSTLPVIVSSSLTGDEEEKLLRVLRDHKIAISWTITDIKGISPSICIDRILMKENYKPSIQPQHRLNPIMKW